MKKLGWWWGGGRGVWQTKCIMGDVQKASIQRLMYRAHVLKWPAAIQIYCNKRKRLDRKNSSTSTKLVWDTKIDEDKAEDRQGRPENNGWTIGNIQPDCRLDWSFCTGHFWITTFYFPNSFCLMRFAL